MIFIKVGGLTKYVKIGEWIDSLIEENRNKVVNYRENEMEYLSLDEEVLISTVDEDGKVFDSLLSAVTRHNPGKMLYKLTTESGRSVTVTESKSCIVWDESKRKFLPKPTPEIKIDDFLPTTIKLTNSDPKNIIQLENKVYTEEECDYIGVEYNKIGQLLKRIQVENGFTLSIITNPRIVEDVILDKVIEITEVSPNLYPKVYDVTVNETLNFGIASGLNIRDTSTTGYIQRKITKLLEDLQTTYIGSVATPTQRVVQFAYGGDGLSADRLIKTKQGLSFVDVGHLATKLNKEVEVLE